RLYNFAIGAARARREGTTTPLASVLVSMIDAGFVSDAMGVARRLQFDNEAQTVVGQALIDRGVLSEAATLVHGMDTSWLKDELFRPRRNILSALLAQAWIRRESFEKGLRFAKQATDRRGLGSEENILLPVVRELRKAGQLEEAFKLVSVLRHDTLEVLTEIASIHAAEMGAVPDTSAKQRFDQALAELKAREKELHMDATELYAQIGIALAKANRL